MSDILNEDEVGHLPHISQSRYERMQEQYNSFMEEENEWQDVRRDVTLHGDKYFRRICHNVSHLNVTGPG